MPLPYELRHWPLGQVNTVLFDIKYRLLPANELILLYRQRERELLSDLWRYDYLVFSHGRVPGEGRKCSVADLRLSPEGEELLDRVWAEYRKTLPLLGPQKWNVVGS